MWYSDLGNFYLGTMRWTEKYMQCVVGKIISSIMKKIYFTEYKINLRLLCKKTER